MIWRSGHSIGKQYIEVASSGWVNSLEPWETNILRFISYLDYHSLYIILYKYRLVYNSFISKNSLT